jgi:uncharacterized protein affecting Mg2+/Co2+ transport
MFAVNFSSLFSHSLGVTIQASPLFIPESSEKDRMNFWAYSITITMSPDEPANRSCQLLSRYWEITANDKTQVTEGPGVIGLHPEVRPGSFFRYGPSHSSFFFFFLFFFLSFFYSLLVLVSH